MIIIYKTKNIYYNVEAVKSPLMLEKSGIRGFFFARRIQIIVKKRKIKKKEQLESLVFSD